MALATRLLPRTTRADRARALRTAIEDAHRHGITSVQHVDATMDDLELYDDARRAGDLDIRVYSALALDRVDHDGELERLGAVSSKYPDDPRFKTGAVSVAIDGNVTSRMAALLAPYEGSEVAGDTLVSADALNRAVRILDAQGWQVIGHAAGDRAVQMALDAFEHAARSNPSVSRGRRHRVDGLVLADARDITRFKALGAIASPFPFNVTPQETWMAVLGVDRTSSVLPIHDLMRARARVAFGSGWPAGPLNPMEAVHAAVNRGADEDASDPSPLAHHHRAGDRRLHERRGVRLVRRTAQGHAQGGHARRPRRPLERHLLRPAVAPARRVGRRHDLRRPRRVPQRAQDDELNMS